jgi:hypothetical protein
MPVVVFDFICSNCFILDVLGTLVLLYGALLVQFLWLVVCIQLNKPSEDVDEFVAGRNELYSTDMMPEDGSWVPGGNPGGPLVGVVKPLAFANGDCVHR